MGYSVDLCKVPKFDGLDDKEAFATYEYALFLNRMDTEWYKQQIAHGAHFEFGEEYGNKELVEFISKNPDTIAKYREWTQSNKTDVDYWCSIGHCFEEDFLDAGTLAFSDVVFLNKEECQTLLDIEQEWMEEHKLVPVSVFKAFKENADETVTLIPCDGVEITFENGSSRRVYTNGEYEDFELFSSTKGCDDEERNARKRLIDDLNTLLCDVDFQNNLVYLVYGW